MRGVRELAEQPGDDERDLLADVDRVVADPLERARHHHHVHRPLARVDVRRRSSIARWKTSRLSAVDLVVLAHEVLGQRDVAQRERLLGLRAPPSGRSAPICEHR